MSTSGGHCTEAGCGEQWGSPKHAGLGSAACDGAAEAPTADAVAARVCLAECVAERLAHFPPSPPHSPGPAAGWPWRNGGLVSFSADLHLPLTGAPLRCGEVWHLHVSANKLPKRFAQATLSLYTNGFSVLPTPGPGAAAAGYLSEEPLRFAWSPFALVQSCRLHSVEADAAAWPWTRLFKVSLFQQSSTHFFAVRGGAPDLERARWAAAVAGALRKLTQLFFPPAVLRTEPLQGASWTSSRLLASYVLLCRGDVVLLVYCELHAHWDGEASLVVYDDELCSTRVMQLTITHRTVVCERVGIDCSCFAVDSFDFSARTAAEKRIWLRAISNLKVKLRNNAANPTPSELGYYRAAILEHAVLARAVDEQGHTRAPRAEGALPQGALLPPVGRLDGGRLERGTVTLGPMPRWAGSLLGAGCPERGGGDEQPAGGHSAERPRGAVRCL